SVGEVEYTSVGVGPLLVVAAGVASAVNVLGFAPSSATLVLMHPDANLASRGEDIVRLETLLDLAADLVDHGAKLGPLTPRCFRRGRGNGVVNHRLWRCSRSFERSCCRPRGRLS